jgi:cell division protein FtsI (penicillin-binding protein 3)
VIARVAPMLGMLPDIQGAPAINQSLYIPLQPGRPAGAPRTPVAAAPPEKTAPLPVKPALTLPATTLAPARPVKRDLRHEASLPASPVVGASVLPTSAASPSLAAR